MMSATYHLNDTEVVAGGYGKGGTGQDTRTVHSAQSNLDDVH